VKILLVDDSNTMRRIIANSLKPLEAEILEAEHGEKALAILREHAATVDLMLLDINMPVMNGRETLEAIKSDDALKHVPVIIVSTEAQKADVVQAISAGAANYVVKPFQPETLIERVRTVLTKTSA
jgi:two-component system, chemotaxis family, chemotaxis protein CheY